jgi:hypothetical protein
MNSVEQHRAGIFGKVVLGYCSNGYVRHEFCDSIIDTMLYDYQQQGILLGVGGGTAGIVSGPRIAETRSQIVDAFLSDPRFVDQTGDRAEWLWMADTDMVWSGDAFYRLLASADPVDRPIVGGLCFAGGRTGKFFPTIYRTIQGEDGLEIEPILEYPQGAMIKVGATGAAFMLIHRSVFIRMSQPWPNGFGTTPDGRKNPYPWFNEGGTDKSGNPYGEDTAFCMKAQAAGFPIHVNTDVRVGHVKTYELNERVYHERNSVGVH